MDGALEFTTRSKSQTEAASAAKSRRSLPPELVHAVDLERLYWSLNIKGLDRSTVAPVPRARRLGVRFLATSANPAIGINAALREIERLHPKPALISTNCSIRRRALSLERWFCNEIAPCVMWWLLNSVSASAIRAPILRALELIEGLTTRHPYLLGHDPSSADITAAAVLAPIARDDGWAWVSQAWTPMMQRGARANLSTHPGARWVRHFYEKHGATQTIEIPRERVWLP